MSTWPYFSALEGLFADEALRDTCVNENNSDVLTHDSRMTVVRERE